MCVLTSFQHFPHQVLPLCSIRPEASSDLGCKYVLAARYQSSSSQTREGYKQADRTLSVRLNCISRVIVPVKHETAQMLGRENIKTVLLTTGIVF